MLSSNSLLLEACFAGLTLVSRRPDASDADADADVDDADADADADADVDDADADADVDAHFST